MSKPKPPPPAALALAARRFEQWRSHRTTREIPPELWRLATELGGRYGVGPTARALRVRYYDLKGRLEARRREGGKAPTAAFVEIQPGLPAPVGTCRVTLEDGHGATMRVDLEGGAGGGLEALARVFLRRRA